MEKVMTILTALAVLTICSCGSNHTASLALKSEGMPVFSTNDTLESTALTDEVPLQPSEHAETIDRKIIKQGEVKFETTDVDKTKSSIVQTVRELNGYISKDIVNDYSHRLEHLLIIRVPADKFDLLLQNISEGVDKFDSKNIDALDVTEEYIDVQSRVKTKKELHARYTELLKQATNVEEMLTIEREKGKLQTEIEAVEGRMRYLRDKIAFSTLTVTFYETRESETDKFSFSSELMGGIKTGWELFLWFLIGLSYLWVFILGAIVFVVVVYLSVRQKKK
jgi:hypothetical protein